MELKQVNAGRVRKSSKCSNRTFMELKLSMGSLLVSLLFGSNRTFMELKHG